MTNLERVDGILGLIKKGESINALYLLELPSQYYQQIIIALKRAGYKRELHSLTYIKETKRHGRKSR